MVYMPANEDEDDSHAWRLVHLDIGLPTEQSWPSMFASSVANEEI